MKLVALQAFSLNIPFRQSFRHASAERAVTQTLWVEARSATQVGYGEGCPREYVTGEGLASAHAFVSRHAGRLCQSIDSVAALRGWITANEPAIDADPAAWCAVELALLDWLGKEAGRPLEALLDLPPLDGSFRYSAVLGDSSAGAFEALLARYREAGFTAFKIKLSGEASLDRDKVRLLKSAGLAPGQRVLLVDAVGPAHARASSGGESRMTRSIYGADLLYTRMALDSLKDWRWLSGRSGLPVLHPTGVLMFFRRQEAFATRSIEVHRDLGLPLAVLDSGELQRRYPQIGWNGVEFGLLETAFGALMARRAVQSLVAEFVAVGGEYRVAAVESPAAGSGLTGLRTRAGDTLRARNFVFACGPWLPALVP